MANGVELQQLGVLADARQGLKVLPADRFGGEWSVPVAQKLHHPPIRLMPLVISEVA